MQPPPDLRIRGFGTAQADRAFDQAVGLAIDGDAFGQQDFFRGVVFDVDRIEGLKGPQGTLFGKNTTAGLVSLPSSRASSS